jgi:hypothetical protein
MTSEFDFNKVHRSKETIKFATRAEALAAVVADETLSVFERLDKSYYMDREIVMAAIAHGVYSVGVHGWRGSFKTEYFHAFQFLTGPLRRDHHVILATLANSGIVKPVIDADLKGHPEFVKLNWRLLEFASDELRNNKAFVGNLLRNASPNVMQFAGPVVRDDVHLWELALANVEHNFSSELLATSLPDSLRSNIPLLRKFVKFYSKNFEVLGPAAHADFDCAIEVALSTWAMRWVGRFMAPELQSDELILFLTANGRRDQVGDALRHAQNYDGNTAAVNCPTFLHLLSARDKGKAFTALVDRMKRSDAEYCERAVDALVAHLADVTNKTLAARIERVVAAAYHPVNGVLGRHASDQFESGVKRNLEAMSAVE